jgi:integrase
MRSGSCWALPGCAAARRWAWNGSMSTLMLAGVSVRQTLQRRRGAGFVLVAPKTPTSRRSVLLTEVAMAALWEHRCRQVARFGNASRFVFTNRTGGPLDGSRATIGFAKALLAAGLPWVRVHHLRHTTASVLLEVGVHPKLVQDLLGHSTIAVTLDT